MANTDSVNVHEQFVLRIMIGIAIAIAGVTAGLAIHSLSPAVEAPPPVITAVRCVEMPRSTSRMERIALRRAATVASIPTALSPEKTGDE